MKGFRQCSGGWSTSSRLRSWGLIHRRAPVLPVALILEWMAEAATARNPGLLVSGVDDFRLFKGVVLGHQKPATVELRAGKPVRRAAEFAVPVEICGTLASGKEVAHARAVIVLSDRLEASLPRLREPELSRTRLREEIYQTVLFHGPLMQGIESVEGCAERGIAGWVSTAPPTSEWLDRPIAQQVADRPAGDRFRVSACRALDPGDSGSQFASHRAGIVAALSG